MDQIFHRNFNKIHFIGVGGISMSGLAKLCLGMGYEVSGSDLAQNAQTRELESSGVRIFHGHSEGNVGEADVVVYSSAVSADNPELRYAILSKRCTVSRGKFLGAVSRTFKRVIAVSGAHGKTTASAMVAEALRRLEYPFCYHIGGVLKYDGENTRYTGDELFLCEACEYKRNFLALRPDIGVVLNVDFDHPDYYRDLEDVRSAYRQFCSRCTSCVGHLSTGLGCRSFCLEEEGEADVTARSILRLPDGTFSFDLCTEGESYPAKSPFLFRHNIQNVLAAFTVLDDLGVDRARAVSLLGEFGGVERRFEPLRTGGLEVYSDYAHHPRQIEGVIRSLKEEGHRVVVVFEPHTYSRTVKLFGGFVEALSLADEVILLPIYGAREVYVPGVLEGLAQEVGLNTACRILRFEEVASALKGTEGVKVLMGAGVFDDWFRAHCLGD